MPIFRRGFFVGTGLAPVRAAGESDVVSRSACVCDHFSDRREASPYDDEVALVLTFSDVFLGINVPCVDPFTQPLSSIGKRRRGELQVLASTTLLPSLSNFTGKSRNRVMPAFAHTHKMQINYTAFFVLRIAFTVVPQTAHWPFSAGLPFFMVTC
jgi:hypothetical protein